MAYKSSASYRKKIKESLNNEFLGKALGNFTSVYPEVRKKAIEKYFH